jgi:hypothetical protein
MFNTYTLMILALVSFTFLDAERLVKEIIYDFKRDVNKMREHKRSCHLEQKAS